jgi:hypothetical protein
MGVVAAGGAVRRRGRGFQNAAGALVTSTAQFAEVSDILWFVSKETTAL